MMTEVNLGKTVPFNNKATHCVGTGRMDLALHKEYLDQLALVQKEIGFSYIRGHGLFSKYMAIFRGYEEDGVQIDEYNFTYLDMVMDSYKELNIKPLLELGFMPDDMASGDQKVFFWGGNVTPPAGYDRWANLVKATLSHLIERYGREEVLTWPVEVWNEPNLPVFWKDADMEEYFKLYEVTANAVKETDSSFRVGGPAICGVDDERWLRSFLENVRDKKLPLDFISRHHYTSYNPERSGHYSFIELHEPEDAFRWLERSRDIVDSFDEFRGMEIFITEFNTSYVPNAPIHDTTLNAAYVSHMLSKLGDKHESYSYWTFGDIFEEWGVQFTPFAGGFGLVADGCIPKPTFWTFAFYSKLMGDCVMKNDDGVIVKTDKGTLRGVLQNPDLHNNKEDKEVKISLSGLEDGEYMITEKIVNDDFGNPLKTWHEMGEPSSLTKEQNELLKEIARPGVFTRNITVKDSKADISFKLLKNELRYFEIMPINRKCDRGYDYERTINQKAVPEQK